MSAKTNTKHAPKAQFHYLPNCLIYENIGIYYNARSSNSIRLHCQHWLLIDSRTCRRVYITCVHTAIVCPLNLCKPVLLSRRFHIFKQVQNKAFIILRFTSSSGFWSRELFIEPFGISRFEYHQSCRYLQGRTRNDIYYLPNHDEDNIYIF